MSRLNIPVCIVYFFYIYVFGVKIVFIDFDWTIFDHRTYSINESTIEAIKQARNKGIKVIINTGRSYYSLLSKQVVRDLKVDGYVVNNGGACIINDSVLYAHYLNKELKDNIINFLIENKISYGINCCNYCIGHDSNEQYTHGYISSVLFAHPDLFPLEINRGILVFFVS